MSRASARFTQADIARALRAIEQEKARAAIEIRHDGVIRIVPFEPADTRDEKTKWLASFDGKEIVL